MRWHILVACRPNTNTPKHCQQFLVTPPSHTWNSLTLPFTHSYSFISIYYDIILSCVSLALHNTPWHTLAHPGTWNILVCFPSTLSCLGTAYHTFSLPPYHTWNFLRLPITHSYSFISMQLKLVLHFVSLALPRMCWHQTLAPSTYWNA